MDKVITTASRYSKKFLKDATKPLEVLTDFLLGGTSLKKFIYNTSHRCVIQKVFIKIYTLAKFRLFHLHIKF